MFLEVAGEDDNQEEEKKQEDDQLLDGSMQGISSLMDHIRQDQNAALAAEDWRAAAEMERATMVLLDRSFEGPELSMEEVMQIRAIFKRLYRQTRNNGHYERADKYQRYIDEMVPLMGRA